MPKKTKKKKVTAEFKRRSIAAKKGVITRKKNIAKAKREAAKQLREAKTKAAAKKLAAKVRKEKKAIGLARQTAKKIVKKKTSTRRKNKKSNASIRLPAAKEYADLQLEVIELRAALDSKKEWERIDRMTQETFVTTVRREWLHEDGTLAIQPSRFRGSNEEGYVRRMMSEAEERGDLFETAHWLSEYFDTPIQEVYTVFISP